jgi:hypothetical protein
MKSKWYDPTDGEIYSRIELIEKFAEFLRKEFSIIAEEHRSLGFLNETISQCFANSVPHQFPQTQAITAKFISSITTIESVRKLFYHRSHLLSGSAFQSTLDHSKLLKPRLKERDQAVGRYLATQALQARAMEVDPVLRQRIAKDTSAYQTQNLQTIQAVCSFQNQLNRELVAALTAFAHSQMEMYVKSIQTWAELIEEIEGSSIESDLEVIEEGMKKILLTIPGLTRPRKTEVNDDDDDGESDTRS